MKRLESASDARGNGQRAHRIIFYTTYRTVVLYCVYIRHYRPATARALFTENYTPVSRVSLSVWRGERRRRPHGFVLDRPCAVAVRPLRRGRPHPSINRAAPIVYAISHCMYGNWLRSLHKMRAIHAPRITKIEICVYTDAAATRPHRVTAIRDATDVWDAIGVAPRLMRRGPCPFVTSDRRARDSAAPSSPYPDPHPDADCGDAARWRTRRARGPGSPRATCCPAAACSFESAARSLRHD